MNSKRIACLALVAGTMFGFAACKKMVPGRNGGNGEINIGPDNSTMLVQITW